MIETAYFGRIAQGVFYIARLDVILMAAGESGNTQQTYGK